MLIVINITSLSYVSGAFSFSADVFRDDSASHNITITNDTSLASLIDFVAHAKTANEVYKLIADVCSNIMDSTFSTSIPKDQLNYMFLGLSIYGPFHNLPEPTELVFGVL